MAIYPERNRRTGNYTGTWIVEVTTAGSRYRERATSMDEAKVIEAKLKGESVDELIEPSTVPARYLMRDLDRAVRYTLWRDQKDEQETIQRWRATVEILGPDTLIADIRKPALERLVEALRKRKTRKGGTFSPKTVNRYLATVSKAFRWAFESDLIPAAPPIPWQEEGPGREAWLREADQQRLLDYLRDQYGQAYAFLTEVLVVTGVRVAELLNLKPDQIENDSIRLLATQTKTGKPRLIPLPEGYGARLVGFIWDGLPPYRELLNAIREASVALELPEVLTPHALRHTAATRLKAQGVNVLTIMDLLGHTSIATTKGYSHSDDVALREAVDRLHKGYATPQKTDRAERGENIPTGKGPPTNPLKTGDTEDDERGHNAFAVLCVATPPRGQ